MANETFKMGALRHPYGAGRATGGHARPRQAGTTHLAAPNGHVAQLGPRRGVRPLVLRGALQGGGERLRAAAGWVFHCAALSGRLLRRVSGRLRCRGSLVGFEPWVTIWRLG